MRADSRGVFRNSTIVENGFYGSGWTAAGVHQGAANLTLENSIVAFNRNGWHHTGDPPLTDINHSIFYNPGGQEVVWDNDPGRPDLTINGNRIADPLFVNRFEENYQLLAGSPAIDAGAGTVAPDQDLLGQARFDDVGIADRGSGSPLYTDIGAYEYQGRTDTADLAVTQVTLPLSPEVSVGDTFTASWTVANQGDVVATAGWSDRLYLSADTVISADDILLETRQHTTDLAPGDSYTETVTTTVPVTAGPQYLLVTTDATEQVTESDEVNNSLASVEPLAVAVPVLTAGTSVTGAVQAGEWTYFRITTAPGEAPRLDLDAAVANGAIALYGRAGAPPTLTTYDVAALAQQPDQTLNLPTAGGDYYIGVYGQSLTGAASFSLAAEIPAPTLYGVTQSSVNAGGQTTLELVGERFTDTDTIKLIAPDGVTELTPIAVQNQDATRTFVTFDLAGVDLGAYDVVLEPSNGATALQLSDAIAIQAQATTQTVNFAASLSAPDYVRPGREVTVTVSYQNLSGADLSSPLLSITSDQELEWQLPGTDQWVTDTSVSVLALSNDGPASRLQAGETDTLSFTIRTPLNTEPINFELYALQGDGSGNSSQAVNWDELEVQSRPEGLSDEAWAAIWDNVQAQTGSTWADFVAMLGDNAAYLQGLGRTVYSSQELLAFEVLQANGLNPETYLAAGEDAFTPAPGLDLRFVRVYGQSVGSRYTDGPMGYGWTHNYDLYFQETSDGRILVHWADGAFRSFVADGQGGYVGVAGEEAVLTRNSDGTVQLREPSGLTMTLAALVSGATIRDTNGNTLTASYTGGQLSQITHSAGQSLTLGYTEGNLTQVMDQDGQTTTYQYDPTGDFLTQVTIPDGQTTTYGYDGANRALTSISNATGNTLTYTYDSLGRLRSAGLNGGAETVTYSYDSAGTVTVTDAAGTASQLFFDERGIPSQIQDGEGRVYGFGTSPDGNLVQITQPDGSTGEIQYDAAGYPTQIIDASGNAIALKFDPTNGNLQWIRDAKGNTMGYDYDAAGNLTQITYADGSAEQFSSDAQGNLTSYTNRRGETITYSYTDDGLIAQQTNPGETPAQYTYDTEGKLQSVVNAQGTTTLTYDVNDRLAVITYPNGRFLAFEYDAVGRRTQLTGSDGYEVNYSYDAVGRLDQLTDGDGGLIVDYAYDVVGRLAREDKGNGTYSTYDYFADGQLKSLVHYAPDGSVNSRFDYTYDDLGRQVSAATSDGTWTYGYDATGQLTRAVFASTNPQIADQDLTYVYDAAGNRIRTVRNGVTTEYTTNNLNQYETVGDATIAMTMTAI
jgi:YD repeat-containing protein